VIGPGCAGGLCAPCATTVGVDAGVCALDSTYRYGHDGGRVAFRDTVVLAAPASFTHLRDPVATMPASLSCAPPFPICDGAAIDVADVMAALADPDVQLALLRSKGAVTLPFYGVDPRPVDGQAFQLTHDGGGGFLVGGPCPPGSSSTCMEIPAGVSRLVSVLTALDQQQLADPSCATLRP
jgi:hypothetical protein